MNSLCKGSIPSIPQSQPPLIASATLLESPGDDVVDEFAELVRNRNEEEEDDDDGDAFVSVNQRMYGKAECDGEPLSLILYREQLVKTFNSRGFVNFRNLARISRPKRRKKKQEEERDKGNERIWMSEMAVLEVVEDEEHEGRI